MLVVYYSHQEVVPLAVLPPLPPITPVMQTFSSPPPPLLNGPTYFLKVDKEYPLYYGDLNFTFGSNLNVGDLNFTAPLKCLTTVWINYSIECHLL